MGWGFFRQFPKYALVIGLIVGSTVLFALWWLFRTPKDSKGQPIPVEDFAPKIAHVEAHWERLVLVDNDLYDIENGALIFRRWLKDGMPEKLFYDATAKKFLAKYPAGFVRYGAIGAVEAKLFLKDKPAFSDDFQWVLFAREKDIWRAEVNWKELRLVNERKLTSVEQFNDQYFADSIVLRTDKTLLVRVLNKVLHVDLGTGAVQPMDMSLNGISKRISPDSKAVVGVENGRFFFYEVDTNDAKYLPLGRTALNDYQWLGNDGGAVIAAMRTVLHFDRAKRTLTEVVALPFPCNQIGEPSPDGRFVFCANGQNRKGVLVDVTKKTATPVVAGEGVSWVSNDTFAFSREVTDSELRGTWLQTVGQNEGRILPEPYLVHKSGAALLTLKSAGLVVMGTKHGLSKTKPDGTEAVEVVKLAGPQTRALGIEKWSAD